MSSPVEILDPQARDLFDPDAELERVATGFAWAEGPVWHFDGGFLTFSDVVGDRIHRYDDAGGVGVHREPSEHANGQTVDDEGRLVNCVHQTRRLVRETADGVETLADSYQGRRLNSPNDVLAARDGSLLFTDPFFGLSKPEEGGGGEAELTVAGVYRLAPGESEPTLLTADLSGPNGLALSPDEDVLYVADTDREHVRRFAVAPDWGLTDQGVFVDVPTRGEELPDGMKVDVRGNLYCSGRGGIWVFSPNAVTLAHIVVPQNTANFAWGDADARTLYITADSSVYRLRCRVAGYAPHAHLDRG